MSKNNIASGSNILYILLFAVALLLIIVALCRTVLFNVRTIEVNEDNPYTAATVVSACRLKLGENILGMDLARKRKLALESLPYAEDVTISVTSPSKLSIRVTPAKERILLENSGLIVSDKGKVLGKANDGNSANPLLLHVTGYAPVGAEIGKDLPDITDDIDLKEITLGLTELIDTTFDIAKVKRLDLTNYLNITLLYEGRIEIQIGSYSDAATKLRNALAVIQDEVGADEIGVLRASNLSKISFNPRTSLD